jgi:hypothetical protein
VALLHRRLRCVRMPERWYSVRASVMDMTPRCAAALLSRIRQLVAIAPEGLPLREQIIEEMLAAQLAPLHKCPGAAHFFGVDATACAACLEQVWGWTGEELTIRGESGKPMGGAGLDTIARLRQRVRDANCRANILRAYFPPGTDTDEN